MIFEIALDGNLRCGGYWGAALFISTNTLRLHADTLKNYIHILEKCFHIELVKPFHKNVRKEIKRNVLSRSGQVLEDIRWT